jgi:hypothetical protein
MRRRISTMLVSLYNANSSELFSLPPAADKVEVESEEFEKKF